MGSKERAKKLLGEMCTIYLATLKDDGLPDVRAISATKSEGLETIWMISGQEERKSKELTKNPNCMVYTTAMQDDEHYVELRLWGTAELLTDTASRQTAWHEAYNDYFKDINDPTIQVIKFTAKTGTITTEKRMEEISF